MSFTSDSLHTIIIKVALVGTGLLNGIINARWLGPEGMGIVALLLLVNSFAFRFGNLGFGSAFAFFVAKEKRLLKEVLPLLVFASISLSLFSSAIIFNIKSTFISPWSDIETIFFIMVLVAVPFSFFNNYIQRALSGKLKITAINKVSLISGVININLLVIFVIILDYNIIGSILAIVMTEIASTTMFIWLVRCEIANEKENLIISNKLELFSNMWNYGRWNFLLMLTNFLVEEMPLVLLKKFTGSNVIVGLFSRARSMGRQSRAIVEPFSKVLFPYTASSTTENATRRTNILCRNSIVIMGTTVALIMFFIEQLILLLYGAEYLQAVPIFYALAPGVILWPIGQFLEVHVAASGRPKDVFYMSVFTLVIGALISVLLIPKYGAIGAGLSISIIYLVRATFRIFIYVRVTKTNLKDIIFVRKSDFKLYVTILKNLTMKFRNRNLAHS